MKLMTKSRCTCGQEFNIVHGCKTCRTDGKWCGKGLARFEDIKVEVVK